MPIVSVDDADDPRLDDYRNVPDPELLERRRLFVAEGRLVVGRLLTGRRLVTRSVLVTPSAHASIAESLSGRPDLPVYVVPQGVMSGITGFNIHRGCIAIGERPRAMRWQDVIADTRTIIVLERVANADNVGGVFRNAAAFGAGAILLDPTSTDPLYRKAIRTSMGAALTVPFARLEPWPDALEELRRRGYVLVAMTPSAATALPESAEELRRAPIAMMFGHEGEGLTPAALAACDRRLRIPIAPEVDSLNVAASTAIALYELRMI